MFGPDGKIAAADYLSRFSWIPPNRVWVYFRRRLGAPQTQTAAPIGCPYATTNHSPAQAPGLPSHATTASRLASSIVPTGAPNLMLPTPSSTTTSGRKAVHHIGDAGAKAAECRYSAHWALSLFDVINELIVALCLNRRQAWLLKQKNNGLGAFYGV